MILADEFIKLNTSQAFKDMFLVVIQLGAILAVVVLYFHKLNPFSRKKTPTERRDTFTLWGKVIVSCLPAAVIGLLFDDMIESIFFNYVTVSIMLILYGVLFILVRIGTNAVGQKYARSRISPTALPFVSVCSKCWR